MASRFGLSLIAVNQINIKKTAPETEAVSPINN